MGTDEQAQLRGDGQTTQLRDGEVQVIGSGYPDTPPARVSSDPNHRDFHPSCKRIAVLVDGVPRDDVHWYDAPGGVFRIVGDGRKGQLHSGQVVVYWRWPESRQERRARERWDSKHPQPTAVIMARREGLEGTATKPSEAQWKQPAADQPRRGAIGSLAVAAAVLALSSGA